MVFRVLIFRPMVKELLHGVVKSVDPAAGACITLQFMDDVWVPLNLLREGMKWRAGKDGGNGCWYWQHVIDEGEEALDLSLRVGDPVLVRVAAVAFGEPTERSALGDRPCGTKGGAKVARDSQPGPSSSAPQSGGLAPKAPMDSSTAGASSQGKVTFGAEGMGSQPQGIPLTQQLSILAGGEAGDGVHVPMAKMVMSAGGVASQLPPPSLEIAPSLRRLLGQSAASRGVSSLDAVLGMDSAVNASVHGSLPRGLRGAPDVLGGMARRQMMSLNGEGHSKGGRVGSGLYSSSLGGSSGNFSGEVAGPAASSTAVSRHALGLGAVGATGVGGKGKSTLTSPLTVYCSIAEDGLGCVKWWEGDVEEETLGEAGGGGKRKRNE